MVTVTMRRPDAPAASVRDRERWAYGSGPDSLEPGHAESAHLCGRIGCGHPRSNHADCGRGPCRTNVSIALWHDGDDRKDVPCQCQNYYEPVETREVDPRG